jgi:predicted MPP superfamily phosphohydrolase
VACSHVLSRDAGRLSRAVSGAAGGPFTLLLYHSPDLIEEAARQQIDLYLAGHTHGGQIRLPFYGALFTRSEHGRQYVSGLFERDGTTAYVSRGLGLEGSAMPRARFLCRPEIVSFELRGALPNRASRPGPGFQ